VTAAATQAPPSIGARLANALLSWSVAWGLAVGLAVWLAAAHEVDELLDDALQSSAELMAEIVRARGDTAAPSLVVPGAALERFAWQVVGTDGAVLLRSPRAPAQAWHRSPQVGFGNVPQWRVFGQVLGSDGRLLYAAQTRDERDEARAEVALGAVLAALAVGLLGHLWLRLRVRRELEPLQRLSQRLAAWDPDDGGSAAEQLGPAERSELQPVHGAIEALTLRLAARMANEQAFSAHAAHALRTPLAGIDAQLAVALRECPPDMRERLLRVRGAATRLQAVVAALLALFRSGEGGARLVAQAVDLPALVARLPVPGLAVQVEATGPLQADPDLLAAALMNLLDNAQRHGARTVHLRATAPATLRIDDDGPGVDAERLARLREAIDSARTTEATGLGLVLADRVARAHGGRLLLPDTAQGFAVELRLQAEGAA
jgi:signal transduction histidine kinase